MRWLVDKNRPKRPGLLDYQKLKWSERKRWIEKLLIVTIQSAGRLIILARVFYEAQHSVSGINIFQLKTAFPIKRK